MKRNVGLPIRLCVAGGAFALMFGAAAGSSLLCLSMLQHRQYDQAAMGGLLLVWSLLAYFPARIAYVAVTFRRPGDGIRCDSCGYDLTGNESGVCPECGAPADVTRIARRRTESCWGAPHMVTNGGRHRGRGLVIALALFATAGWASFGAAWYSRGPSADLPADLDRVEGNFCFAQWNRASSFLEADADSVFAVVAGSIQVRFTFLSPERQVLGSVGAFDSAGRAWFDIDLIRGQYNVHDYGSGNVRASGSPARTYMDTDSDLLPDQMKDWSSGLLNCVDDSPSWHPCQTSAENGTSIE